MSDSFEKALDAMQNGQGLPLLPPCGEANCPVGRVRIGIFFDGTGNNLWVDEGNVGTTLPKEGGGANGPTNVAKLFRAYKKDGIMLDKAYHHGVGTDYAGWVTLQRPNANDPDAKPSTPAVHRNLSGTTLGAGGKARIEWGLRMLAEFFSNDNKWRVSEKYFDICGFSRGAALARDFANQVRAQRIANLTTTADPGFFTRNENAIPSIKTEFQATAMRMFHQPIDPNTVYPKFMAIFDTVAAWGPGTGTFLPDVNHAYVEHCVHLVAEDEFRSLFPLTSVFMDPNTDPHRIVFPQLPNRPPRPPTNQSYQNPRAYKQWLIEVWYPGCHSDIGGSYLPRNGGIKPDIQYITLRDMNKAMLKAEVPINKLDPAIDGDLVTWYSEYCAFRADKDWAEHLDNPNGRYIHWFETDEFMARFYGPDDHPDLVNRGLNAGIVALANSGGGMGGGYMPPPPTRPPPPHAQWDARLTGMQPREKVPAVQNMVRDFIHDSATEMTGSSLFGEARPADGRGRLRLQRKVIQAGAQPQYLSSNGTCVIVRNEHRPPRSTF